jgi:hypothetical protein
VAQVALSSICKINIYILKTLAPLLSEPGFSGFKDFQDKTSEPYAHTLLTRWRTAEGLSFSGLMNFQNKPSEPGFTGCKDFQDISCTSLNPENPGSDNGQSRTTINHGGTQ